MRFTEFEVFRPTAGDTRNEDRGSQQIPVNYLVGCSYGRLLELMELMERWELWEAGSEKSGSTGMHFTRTASVFADKCLVSTGIAIRCVPESMVTSYPDLTNVPENRSPIPGVSLAGWGAFTWL